MPSKAKWAPETWRSKPVKQAPDYPDAKAVAAGVREGWSRDKPLNVNTATREQLMSLPDVTDAEADRVIAGRPYDDPSQLVTRRILPKSKYDKIADRLIAKK